MLQGKLVALRAVEKEDGEHVKEWLADADLLHALGARPIPLSGIDPEKLPDMFRMRDGRALAILTKDRLLIGLAMLGNLHEYNRTASILLVIGDKSEWNRGYGTDALRTVVKFAFEDLNLNCIEALIPQFNQRAQHVFQKAGFQTEGTLRRRFFGRGQYWDIVVASVVRGAGEPVASGQTAAAASTPQPGEVSQPSPTQEPVAPAQAPVASESPPTAS